MSIVPRTLKRMVFAESANLVRTREYGVGLPLLGIVPTVIVFWLWVF